MADPNKGRGRGLALLQALKKTIEPGSDGSSPEATPAPSEAPSAATGTSTASAALAGRGRLAAMFQQKLQTPGGPVFSPASDVSPAPAPQPRSMGRGLSLLKNLQSKPQVAATGSPSEVSQVTTQLSQTTLGTQSVVGKNKYYREVKETPPVVKKGESGRPCEVTCNYIHLKFKENNVFEYEVKFEPEQDYKNLRFKLVNEHIHLFKTKTFDGTTMYLPHQLPNEITELISTNPFDQSKVKILIIFRRTRRLSEMVHIYNVLFKQIMNDLQLVRFGRQHFNEMAAIQIPQHKLEVWPGYVTAVDEYEGGLMLTLDSTHRVLRTQSVLSLIKETIQSEGTYWKKTLTEILIGCSVMTTYNKKLFRVDSIDDTMTPKSTFEKTEGGKTIQISYIDYYKKNYGIDIMDWNQPMLISRDTKRLQGQDKPTDFLICLVPELCQMTGLTDDQRNNFKLMKDVATYTRITPNQRHAAFKQYIKNVLENEAARNRLLGWGLTIDDNTISLTARTLQPETLLFGEGHKVDGKPNADWNMEVSKHPVMQAVDLLEWVVMYTKRDQQVANEFVNTILRCGRPMGININKPEMVLLPTDRTDSYINGLKKCITNTVRMVVAICPTARDDRYAAIKKICCVDHPVPSQVIKARTIMNPQKLRSITQKILLQMNCKLGGTLWSIAIPFKTAMIVGIDTYHDGPRKKRSVCAFIASYNQSCTHWYSKAVFQEQGQEIVDALKSFLIDAAQQYLRVNGMLPEKIIIYRDGVGDGQLTLLQKYEVPQLQICFTAINTTYKPTLTYIVVQKRINTRIFMKARGGYENPPPGTVLDHAITRRDWYDFLIASQKVDQGTVTPTHYIVIHDSSGMTPDQCQRLTYKLCHLYYNWPGTVRVPAPCQYAHRLAYLVGQNIHQQPSLALADKLFFL